MGSLRMGVVKRKSKQTADLQCSSYVFEAYGVLSLLYNPVGHGVSDPVLFCFIRLVTIKCDSLQRAG
jgi:hypothetical protein